MEADESHQCDTNEKAPRLALSRQWRRRWGRLRYERRWQEATDNLTDSSRRLVNVDWVARCVGPSAVGFAVHRREVGRLGRRWRRRAGVSNVAGDAHLIDVSECLKAEVARGRRQQLDDGRVAGDAHEACDLGGIHRMDVEAVLSMHGARKVEHKPQARQPRVEVDGNEPRLQRRLRRHLVWCDNIVRGAT